MVHHKRITNRWIHMKKIIAAVLAALLLDTLAAGCEKKDSSESPAVPLRRSLSASIRKRSRS